MNTYVNGANKEGLVLLCTEVSDSEMYCSSGDGRINLLNVSYFSISRDICKTRRVPSF